MPSTVNQRRSLTPPTGSPAADLHATRRATGGARRESTDRVFLHRGGVQLEGWTLNISRGGVRIILEDKVELGDEFAVSVGDDSPEAPKRPGRIVWVQEEQDGVVAGIEFLDRSATSVPPPPEPPKE